VTTSWVFFDQHRWCTSTLHFEWYLHCIINSSPSLYLMPSMRSQHASPSWQERRVRRSVDSVWVLVALIKRLRKLGLTDAYWNDEESQTIFRCLLALPLLPVSDIAPGFQELKSLVTSQLATSATVTQLLRYVERQWINKSTVGPSRLSVRDNPSRTNNSMESFHAALRRRTKVSHPNMFAFLGHLQRIPLLTVRPMLTVSAWEWRF